MRLRNIVTVSSVTVTINYRNITINYLDITINYLDIKSHSDTPDIESTDIPGTGTHFIFLME